MRVLSIAFILLTLTSPAWAQEAGETSQAPNRQEEPTPTPGSEAAPAEQDAPSTENKQVDTGNETDGVSIPFHVGFAVKGGPNFSGTTKPDDRVYKGTPAIITYPGFFGVGGVVGFFVEPRLFDIIGVEIGLVYEASQGEGDINDYSVTLSSADLVFPIHLRASIPTASTPVFSIGVDLVVPLSTDIEHAIAQLSSIDVADRDVTTYLGFGLGFEIDAVYVKIPIEIRGRWAAGMEQNYDSRLVLKSSTNVDYKANWELQGQLLLGIKYALPILP
jgi:hypothetical protein